MFKMTFSFHMLREIKLILKINIISHSMRFDESKMFRNFMKRIMLKTCKSFSEKHVNS